MGSSYGILKLSCKLLLICIIIAAPHVDAAITCAHVTESLTPCMEYLFNGEQVPPPKCCTGVKNLYAEARTDKDRQQCCSCTNTAYQSAHSRHPGVNLNRARGIPGKCGVNINCKINSPNPKRNTVK